MMPAGMIRRVQWPWQVLLALLATCGVFVLWSRAFAEIVTRNADAGDFGVDLHLYLDATRSLLGGSGFYPEWQLSGPFDVVAGSGAVVYPPTTIPLFLPFLVLPDWLFLLIPTAIIIWVVAQHRPAPWTWPLIVACLLFPATVTKVIHYNPFIWVAAAVALATTHGWPGAFVLLKPSLAPFALLGFRTQGWWVVIAGFVGVAVLLAPLWPDYIATMKNAQAPAGIFYSITDVPLLLVPILAALGSSRR